ncbi:MAG: hypothetical protein JJE53_01400 [Candidatus Pacebacteria bacterium]|nr:hypothetical protein [Candidatus Paceibacterota bacterium]
MESILKADLYFFITSISVVVISSFIIIALFYFIKILRNFYKISEMLKNYTQDANSELREMGNHVRQSPLFTFIFGKDKSKKESEKSSKKSI